MSSFNESVLVIDNDSLMTKANLFDLVDGTYRFVAQGKAIANHECPRDSIAEALADIESVTQRVLWTDKGFLIPEGADGNGVDKVMWVSGTGTPLRVAVIGVTENYSLAAARSAVESTKNKIVFASTLEGIRSGGSGRTKAQVLVDSAPDVVLITGGTGSGSKRQLEEICRFLASTRLRASDSSLLTVVLAVPEGARASLLEILSPLFEVRCVEGLRMDENKPDLKPIIDLLDSLYLLNTFNSAKEFGQADLREESLVISDNQALSLVSLLLSRLYSCDALVIGVDSESAGMYRTEGEKIRRKIISDAGLGRNSHRLVSNNRLGDISRWLSHTPEPEVIANYLLNKSLRPYTLAQTPEELDIELAALREVIRSLQPGDSTKTRLIVATGGLFTDLALNGKIFLTLLDSIEPKSIARLKVDTLGILPSVGALAMVNQQAAAEILRHDALVELGTVIAPIGSMADGELALTANVKLPDESRVEVQVSFGNLEVVPLPTGTKATISLQLSPSLRLMDDQQRRQMTFEVYGGAVGIVFDARGRPLTTREELSSQPSRGTKWTAVLNY